MNLLHSLRSEILKTRRTPAFWISLFGAFFIPAIFFLAYTLNEKNMMKLVNFAPWAVHFAQGWSSLNSFLFPMYIILLCALITQIEFKNNAWKQVFSSPQSIANIYFSKFITVHLIILFFYLMYNFFMISCGLGADLIHPKYKFIDQRIDWIGLLRLNGKTYVSILGITAIQFWLSLRFKSFVAPVGIGLALLIGGIIAMGFQWEHVSKIPYSHPVLTLQSMMKGKAKHLENHELNSIGYFVVFTILGFLDLKYRKEKG